MYPSLRHMPFPPSRASFGSLFQRQYHLVIHNSKKSRYKNSISNKYASLGDCFTLKIFRYKISYFFLFFFIELLGLKTINNKFSNRNSMVQSTCIMSYNSSKWFPLLHTWLKNCCKLREGCCHILQSFNHKLFSTLNNTYDVIDGSGNFVCEKDNIKSIKSYCILFFR